MNKVFFVFNQDGEELARKVMGNGDELVIAAKGELQSELEKRWDKENHLVVLGSVGIAVRSISKFLDSKWTDPPVVSLDTAGNFAVALAGGHHGANELALELASKIGAKAVITTASDLKDIPAIDVLAQEQGWLIENKDKLASVQGKLNRGVGVRFFIEVKKFSYCFVTNGMH